MTLRERAVALTGASRGPLRTVWGAATRSQLAPLGLWDRATPFRVQRRDRPDTRHRDDVGGDLAYLAQKWSHRGPAAEA